MSHTLYTTECIVLDCVDSGEANRYISLFTREIGLVRAVARSVREEKSKLRYSLQNFSFSYATLVRGREVWRITGAEEKYSIHHDLKHDSSKLYVVIQVLNLLNRLLHGEEKNEYLFDTLEYGLDFLRENELEKKMLKNFEYLVVLRILYSLGYIANKEEFGGLLKSTKIEEDLLINTDYEKKRILFAINNALKEAHL